MNNMHKKYQDKGLIVLAVNEDSDRTEADKFLNMIPAEFLIAYDPNSELAETIQLQAMPSSFLIGKDGTVVKKELGFKTSKAKQYESAIRSALGLAPQN